MPVTAWSCLPAKQQRVFARAPENKISASVISIYGGVSQGGQNSVITLSKGADDGLKSGHVLALYRKGE